MGWPELVNSQARGYTTYLVRRDEENITCNGMGYGGQEYHIEGWVDTSVNTSEIQGNEEESMRESHLLNPPNPEQE